MRQTRATAIVTPTNLPAGIRPAEQLVEVFAIKEGIATHFGIRDHVIGLNLIRTNSEAVERRDSRYWLNPRRCFAAPVAYNYRAKNNAEISINSGLENLEINVNVRPRKDNACFVIKVARILDGRAVDIYDTLFMRVNNIGMVEFIHSYPPSKPLASKSRVAGLDEKRSDLHVVLPEIKVPLAPLGKTRSETVPPAAPLSVVIKSAQRSRLMAVSPTHKTRIDALEAEILQFGNARAKGVIGRFDTVTLRNLMIQNNYEVHIGPKLYNCKPCSSLASKIWYTAMPKPDGGLTGEDYEEAFMAFKEACEKAKSDCERLPVDVASLECLFEHKFLRSPRALTNAESGNFFDAMNVIFPDSEIGVSTEYLYIPAETITKDGTVLGKAYILTYEAIASRGASSYEQLLRPNLDLFNLILGKAGKETYATLPAFEKSLGLSDSDHDTGAGVGSHLHAVESGYREGEGILKFCEKVVGD